MTHDDPACPECGGAMKCRTNGATGQKFYGCLGYPDCGGTRPYEPRIDDEVDDLPSDRYRRADRERWRK